MITKRIVFTLLVIASLLGARAGSLHAQNIGGNNCSGISLGFGSSLNCSMDASQICVAGNCIPWTAGCSESNSNSCSTASFGTVCSGTLSKSQAFQVGFPDGTTLPTTPASLQGSGVTVTSQQCSGIGTVIPIFPRLECWPLFFQPVVSDGMFSVTETDNILVAIPDICAFGQQINVYGCSNGMSTTIFPGEVDAFHTCCAATCNSSGGGGTPGPNPLLLCDSNSTNYSSNCSPIVVDVIGDGYELTDLAHGVAFNLTGQGPQRFSWTDPKHGNAWLALDRNGNGVIDDGSELFGNFTPQPTVSGVSPNGFLALAVYDLPKNGGNENGIIDPGDAIWSRLRLWIDSNQNGISEPGELHTLDEFGIAGIDLDYHVANVKDKYGNQFRYRGRILEREKNNTHKRTIWDGFLLHQP